MDAEMQRGLLPGALALSAKFVPAIRAVAARTVEVREKRLQAAPLTLALRGDMAKVFGNLTHALVD